jgi:hypothetical protein
MRSHGVPNFADPNSQGAFSGTSNGKSGNGVNPQSPQFQSAQRACSKLLPGGTPAQQAQRVAQALQFARCMRSHGEPGFPDPDSQGSFKVGKGSGVDPSSSRYRAAQQACQHYLPGAGGAS